MIYLKKEINAYSISKKRCEFTQYSYQFDIYLVITIYMLYSMLYAKQELI